MREVCVCYYVVSASFAAPSLNFKTQIDLSDKFNFSLESIGRGLFDFTTTIGEDTATLSPARKVSPTFA